MSLYYQESPVALVTINTMYFNYTSTDSGNIKEGTHVGLNEPLQTLTPYICMCDNQSMCNNQNNHTSMDSFLGCTH